MSLRVQSLYLMTLGRTRPWDDDDSPPSYAGENVLASGLAARLLDPTNGSHVMRTRPWTTGTVYDEYEDPSTNRGSYVTVTDSNIVRVYKCLDNNGGSESTTEPTVPDPIQTPVRTDDGYVWKYMLDVDLTDDFVVRETPKRDVGWIPVAVIGNDSTNQRIVQDRAIDGSIEHVVVGTRGSGYVTNRGTVQQVLSPNKLAIEFANTAHDYVGYTYHSGDGQNKKIVGHSNELLTFSTDLDPGAMQGDTYVIRPTLRITDAAGSGARGIIEVSANGAIDHVTMERIGLVYSSDTVVEANTSFETEGTEIRGSGSGAELLFRPPPPGGHGSDQISELGANTAMITANFIEDEDGIISVDNEFRQVSLVGGFRFDNDKGTNDKIYDLTTRLDVSSVTDVRNAWTPDTVVTGSQSEATGYVVAFANTNSEGTTGLLRVNEVVGTFTDTDVVTTQIGAHEAFVQRVIPPDIDPGSGAALVVNNVSPIGRLDTQTETIKMIIEF